VSEAGSVSSPIATGEALECLDLSSRLVLRYTILPSARDSTFTYTYNGLIRDEILAGEDTIFVSW
jgi:hypothetical protein